MVIEFERYKLFWRATRDLVGSFVPAVVVGVVILETFIPNLSEQHHWFEAWVAAIFVALFAGRQLARLLIGVAHREKILMRQVLVVGEDSLTRASMVTQIQQSQYAHDYNLVGIFNSRLNSLYQVSLPSEVASRLSLIEYVQNYAVDLVIIALPWTKSIEIFKIINHLQGIAVDVVVPFPTFGGLSHFKAPMDFIDTPVLQVVQRPLKGSQNLWKIVEDYAVAAAAVALTFPLMLAAAMAIRLESEGPILFRQTRIGMNCKPFITLKFRTMTIDPNDDGSRGTKRNSPRVTRVGRFLRHSSIDELPQLFNVLRGEMSIVGPRPHVANMLVGESVYTNVVCQYAARHQIKPGITGWAQINGMRGGINSMEKAKRSADLDLFYISNWSLRLDLKIMIRTLFQGLFGRDVF